ncbi:LADA_0B02740g1_1 [Lachancea dasiensis]|uniref:LADA_0B02740g1_1 n=1 Tax=Lachancea dasiensis TaxID=1072105 RepID=A0A1G4ISD5_9SACH|nr:LADA_0B02740g1_1 [Lachancea dasiensis]
MPSKCQVCEVQISKYKCPKCGIRYCSLTCFKDEIKHVHNESTQQPVDEGNRPDGSQPNAMDLELKKLKTDNFDRIYQKTPEIQELLSYNTVKFHLAKVYRILSTGSGALGSAEGYLSTEAKQQLAVDYLNTLRYGGIHHNEAIEEFCQIALAKLDAGSPT